MKNWQWALIAILILFATAPHAEGGCPQGMIPANGTNINSCVPIPPGYYQNQQEVQQPAPPVWAERWGALATDTAKGVLGAAKDMASAEQAEQAALADCAAKGGTQCKSEGWYGNGCIAMIVGDKNLNVHTGKNLNEAIQLGVDVCGKEDKNCHVYYSDCSLPVRIR